MLSSNLNRHLQSSSIAPAGAWTKFLRWRSERSAYKIEDVLSSHCLMLLRIVSTMRLYTSMWFFLTGSEAEEISPMDISPTLHLPRLCRLIGRASFTTRSRSVSLSRSGWSLVHWTNFAVESRQTWKSSRFYCILSTNWPIIRCTVSRSSCTNCREA